MADGERTKVRLDAFTAKVVPDPKNPSGSLLLTGFLGASSESKQTRIYWDASLSSYVDVDTADIIHSEPIPKEQSPLGGSYIWVKRSAEVSMGSAGGSTAKGKFFQGPLMAAYGGTFGAAGGAGTQPFITHFICPPPPPPKTPLCPVHSIYVWWCPQITHGGGACSEALPCAAGPGAGPVEGQAMAAAAGPQAMPSLICSYAPHCWFSWGACPTFVVCGPHATPHCPQAAAAAPQWIPPTQYHCWWSRDACPTMWGGCTEVCHTAGCGTPGCPMAPGPAAQQAIPGSYAPHCWFSWNACPTEFGCGPHPTPRCPQAVGPAVHTPFCSFNAVCQSFAGGCATLHGVICATPGCPI